jgi:hypothetical protein
MISSDELELIVIVSTLACLTIIPVAVWLIIRNLGKQYDDHVDDETKPQSNEPKL